MKSMAQLGLLGAFVSILLASGPAVADDKHWPLWPSELLRMQDALKPTEDGLDTPDAERLAAIRATDAYATTLIEPLLLMALKDSSSQVVRDALVRCSERKILSCAPAAAEIWGNPIYTTSLRMYALRVLLLEPTKEHVDQLLGAMQSPDPQVRTVAVGLVVDVRFPPEHLERARTQLVAKLSDGVPNVRQTALRSLGTLGPGSGALTVVRQLEDPTPQVRREAGRTLGLMRDPRAAPALLRALRAGDESYVSESLLHALVLLPGPEIEDALLLFLDEPPRGLSRRTIAQKIGLRSNPSEAFLRQLTERLREKDLRRYVLTSLLLQGNQAREILLAARKRGLEPASDLEVRRLLGGVAPELVEPIVDDWRRAPDKTWPAPQDREAWSKALSAPPRDRVAAGNELGRQHPPWLHDAVTGAIARHQTPTGIRGQLVALAAHGHPPPGRRLTHSAFVSYTKLAAWFSDRRLRAEDRCLAGFALVGGRDGPKKLNRLIADTLETVAGDPSAAVRACVARLQPANTPGLLAFLYDPSPEVRASAAFALRHRPKKRRRDRVAQQLARVAAQDTNWRVRENARRAIEARGVRHPTHLAATWIAAQAVKKRPTWVQVHFLVGDELQVYWLPPTILDQETGFLARVAPSEDITVTVDTSETQSERNHRLFFSSTK